jgi:hypothetical protein
MEYDSARLGGIVAATAIVADGPHRGRSSGRSGDAWF